MRGHGVKPLIVVLAASAPLLWGGGAFAATEQALEEQIEEAELELDTSELDAAALEDWAEDELAEARALRSLQRRATALQRRSAVRGWLPRISLGLGLELPRDRAAGRRETAASPGGGGRVGPDDADGAARARLSWSVTLRMVWNLPVSG